MTRLRGLLRSPAYHPWFDQVHPFFWPVLWWRLEVTIAWMKRAGITDVMLKIHWWGGAKIVFTGDKQPDPSAYRPYVLIGPRWDNPSWASDVPLAFAFDPQTVRQDFSSICPCVAGEVAPKQAAGAISSTPIPNTACATSQSSY
jgi:hypothetical protein